MARSVPLSSALWSGTSWKAPPQPVPPTERPPENWSRANKASIRSVSAFGDGGRLLYVLRRGGRAVAVIETRTGAMGPDISFEIAPAETIRDIAIHPDGKRMLLTIGNVRHNISIAEGFA